MSTTTMATNLLRSRLRSLNLFDPTTKVEKKSVNDNQGKDNDEIIKVWSRSFPVISEFGAGEGDVAH